MDLPEVVAARASIKGKAKPSISFKELPGNFLSFLVGQIQEKGMRSMVATQISNIQQLDIDSFQILTSTEDAKEVATAMAGGSETMEKLLINIATRS